MKHTTQRHPIGPDVISVPHKNNAPMSDLDEIEISASFVLQRVGRYVKPYWIYIALATLLSVGARALSLLIPWLVATIVDDATQDAAKFAIDRNAVYLISVFVAMAVLQSLGTVLFGYVGHRMVLSIRDDVFSHIVSLSYDFFERRRVGELISRLGGDTTAIQTIGLSLPINAVGQFVTAVGTVILISAANAKLTMILMMFTPAVFLLAFHFRSSDPSILNANPRQVGHGRSRCRRVTVGHQDRQEFFPVSLMKLHVISSTSTASFTPHCVLRMSLPPSVAARPQSPVVGSPPFSGMRRQ